LKQTPLTNKKEEAFASSFYLVRATGLDCHFRLAEMCGVKSVQPDFSHSPPDCCDWIIQVLS
jgi:hypothetical protein